MDVEKLNLVDWRLDEGESKSEDLTGEHRLPIAVDLEKRRSKIWLDVKMPSGVSHQICLEANHGILNLRAYIAAAGRQSSDEDKKVTYDEAVVEVSLGSDRSFVNLVKEQGLLDRDSTASFSFDHSTGRLTTLSYDAYELQRIAEMLAASDSEVQVPAPIPVMQQE